MMGNLWRHRLVFVLSCACANNCRLRTSVLLLPSIIHLAQAHSFFSETSPKPFGISILQQPRQQQQQLCNESSSLHDVLLAAEQDLDFLVNDMFSSLSLPLSYSIFKGRSALRDLPSECTKLLHPESLGLGTTTTTNNESAAATADATCLFTATLLLLKRQIDASHDMILGVTVDNISEGEYAATHRGQTDWADRHPLTDSADLLHAIVHRLEGSNVGEGNHTGYNNAKYWLAGGPKMLDTPAAHAVRTELAKRARSIAPRCVSSLGLVASSSLSSSQNGKREGVEHVIIAGGGKNRTVRVLDGEWDDFAFVDACKKAESGELSEEERNELKGLQRLEITLFLREKLMKALEAGGRCGEYEDISGVSNDNGGNEGEGGN